MTREERIELLRGEWSSLNTGPFEEARSHGKYWWNCPKGHEFEALYGNRLNKGSNCRICYYQRSPNSAEVIARREEIAGEYSSKNTRPFSDYRSHSSERVWWTCPEHGDYLATPSNRIIKKSNCKQCYLHKRRTAIPEVTKPLSEHPFAKQWSDKNEFGPENYNIGSRKRVWWKCENGHEWQNSIDSRVRQNSGCRTCARNRIPEGLIRRSIAKKRGGVDKIPEVAALWSDKNPEGPENYTKSSNEKVWWRCNNGHPDWKSSVNSVSSGGRCPECNIERRYSTAIVRSGSVSDWITDETPQWSSDNLISADERSIGSKDKVWWQCHVNSDHVWEARIGDITQFRSGCPKCSMAGTSKPEREVADYVESLGFNIVRNIRGVIPNRELDIYIPGRNFAIEFNGLYWHSDRFVDRNYHYDKWVACKEAGIKLFVIWEDDWYYRRDIVKRMLKAKLGLSRVSIGARKTTLVEIDYATAAPFLDKHHIQGRSSGTHYIGLYSGDLVAVGVFRKVGDVVYLDRYASSVRVHGGLRKMMSHLDYNDFITFANREVSDGGLYEKTGWILDKELGPDYSYVVGDRREHKFGYRLKRFETDPDLLYVPGMTERQLADLNELYRVYDYGKDRYRYSLDNSHDA